jgi:acyl-CoA synthetase (AMP-forming)/AMP-acid ligase II
MLIGELLRLPAARVPARPAFVWGDLRITYAEADRMANRIANALIANRLGGGGQVGILSTNTPHYAVIHFAAARAGAVLTHFSFRMTEHEMSVLARRIGITALFVDPLLLERALVLAREVADINLVVVVGDAKRDDYVRSLDEFIADADEKPPSVKLSADSPLAVTFTGGTTRVPKAVLVSHGGRLSSALGALVEFGVDERDIVACAAPLFHTAGIFVWFQMAVALGCTCVMVPTWNPAAFGPVCSREKITALFGVPTQLNSLVIHKGLDVSQLATLRKINFAGAPMPPAQFDRLTALLPNVEFTEHYGQSEFCPITVRNHWRHGEKAPSVGRPVFNAEVAILGPGGEPLPAGQAGEVAVRGDGTMLEYVGEPEETARCKRGDGWLYTGDIGRFDDDGFLTLIDRSKDIIIIGGENVASAEIEAVLYANEAVAECAVFAVPDEHWGEVPGAHVVLRPGASISEKELMAFCGTRFPNHKRPRMVRFVDSLPKTPVGKILKSTIRQEYWAKAR